MKLFSVLREDREPTTQAGYEAANREMLKKELANLQSALVAAINRDDDEEANMIRGLIKDAMQELQTGEPVLESGMADEERSDINARIKKLTEYRKQVAATAKRTDPEGKRAKDRLKDIDKELAELRADLNESAGTKTYDVLVNYDDPSGKGIATKHVKVKNVTDGSHAKQIAISQHCGGLKNAVAKRATLMEADDDKAPLREKLKQLQGELAELPKNPGNQAGYDALDDLHAKIDAVKKQLGEAADEDDEFPADRAAADANAQYLRRVSAIEAYIKSINDKLMAHRGRQQQDKRNWGYPGDLDAVISKLKEVEHYLGGV